MSGLVRLAFQLESEDSGSRLGCAVSAKTLAAQDGPACRRLEWHSIVFATLIAGDLKSLAFSASSSWSTKVGTARIPARLAAFGMSQVAFLIVFLLAFAERESVSTFRASDLDVWHVADSPMRGIEVPPSCFSERKRIFVPFLLAVSPKGLERALALKPCPYGARVRNG